VTDQKDRLTTELVRQGGTDHGAEHEADDQYCLCEVLEIGTITYEVPLSTQHHERRLLQTLCFHSRQYVRRYTGSATNLAAEKNCHITENRISVGRQLMSHNSCRKLASKRIRKKGFSLIVRLSSWLYRQRNISGV